VLAAVGRGTSLADAIRAIGMSGVRAPEPVDIRRGQLAQFTQGGQEIPPPLRILFTLAPGKAQRAAGPSGIYLVRLGRVTPGNASSDPTLIARETTGLNRQASEELALQWLAAAQKELGVERNEDAIKAARQRILGGVAQ
jgi:peptidyl-prolyl cis-trans isomerase D